MEMLELFTYSFIAFLRNKTNLIKIIQNCSLKPQNLLWGGEKKRKTAKY